MKSFSAEFGYPNTIFVGQLVDKSIDAVLFVPDGAQLTRSIPFILKTPGCPDLQIESFESRPTLGSDDIDDNGDIVKPFYENLLELTTSTHPTCSNSIVAVQDAVDIVSDSVLNIEVHIPSLSSEVVKCSGLSKTGKPCGNRRRLATGQSKVYCHHHLNQETLYIIGFPMLLFDSVSYVSSIRFEIVDNSDYHNSHYVTLKY